jgi:hypothetical protein
MSGVPGGIRDEVSRFWNSCFMILTMADESFGKSDTTFHPAEAIHHFVEGVESCFRLLAGMSETRSPLAALRQRNIDVVGRVENLSLFALIYFEIIKREFPATLEPSIVNEQRCGTVVTMSVNRPVREYHVRMLGSQNLSKVVVSRAIHFRIAVNLACVRGPRFVLGLAAFATGVSTGPVTMAATRHTERN